MPDRWCLIAALLASRGPALAMAAVVWLAGVLMVAVGPAHNDDVRVGSAGFWVPWAIVLVLCAAIVYGVSTLRRAAPSRPERSRSLRPSRVSAASRAGGWPGCTTRREAEGSPADAGGADGPRTRDTCPAPRAVRRRPAHDDAFIPLLARSVGVVDPRCGSPVTRSA
jgi:hypothetical protein